MSISSVQTQVQSLSNDGSLTQQQAQQVEQNLENYMNGLTPGSAEYSYASQLLLQIQSYISGGNYPNMVQEIQCSLNSTINGKDIYCQYLPGDDSTSPAAFQSQVEDMLNQIFSNVQPTPVFTVPAATSADTTIINAINEYNSNLPQYGKLNNAQFMNDLETAINSMTSGMSNSDLYKALEGIPTTGVDPSIVSWYNNLLAGLQPSK